MYTAFALTGLIITLIVAGISIWRNRKDTTKPIRLMTAIGSFIEKYHIVFLLLIFAVFLVSRLLKLDSFPNGFHIDELSMSADAKSILYHGTDRWGIHYPAYFRNFGGGQNALYIYVQAFMLLFLPSVEVVFRLQAVFWGAVCFFAVYGICYELTGNKGYALMGPVFVTTLPMYIMSERWGLEAYIFLPIATFVMYLVILTLKKDKWFLWFLTGLFMGVSLYTYAVSYIVWPVFLLLTAAYLVYLKKFDIRRILIFLAPLVILAVPLILFQLVNFGYLEPFRLGVSDYIPLPYDREEDFGLMYIGFLKELFLGGEPLTYNSFKEFGTIYMFLLPFVFIGLVICIIETVKSVKKKEFSIHALILFFWIGATLCMIIVKKPNVNRVNEIFMPFLLFIVIAVHRLLKRNALALSWMAAWTGASFVFFMYFYFFMQNQVYGYHDLFTCPSPGKAIERSEKYYLKDENTHIYMQYADIDTSVLQTYIYAAGPDDVFGEETYTYGNVTARLPEELDVNENAVYIIHNNWPHIISYLISEGFAADQSLPEYSILYRLN